MQIMMIPWNQSSGWPPVAKFKFPLQSVLKYREMLLDQAKKEYAEEVLRRETLEKEIVFVSSQIITVKSEIQKCRNFVISEYKSYQNTLSSLRSLLLEKEDALKQQEDRVEQSRKKLEETLKQMKIMENYKDQLKEEYIDSENKKLQKLLDEIGLQRFSRHD